MKGRYGITGADYDRMLAAQGGVCAACRKAPAQHVDHDHEAGVVRGLLCFNCNQALGNVRDSLQVLDQLASYLAGANGGYVPRRAYLPPAGLVISYAAPRHRT